MATSDLAIGREVSHARGSDVTVDGGVTGAARLGSNMFASPRR
ncbi:MAG: hypothetical protein ACRDQW_03430 [Haloechinothrix sp.]